MRRRHARIRLTVNLVGFLVALAAQSVPSSAQSEKARGSPSIRWVTGPQAARVGAAPQTHWLDEGRLLLQDWRRPGDEGEVRVVGENGVEQPFFDAQRARASLSAAGGPRLQRLGWPSAIDPTGRRLAWVFAGDVFVLNAANSRFTRLTETAAPEHAARFSPNGEFLAYVRDNDLFVASLDGGKERRLTTTGTDTLLNGTLSWVYWEEIFGRMDLAYWWSPDSTSIAFLESDESAVGLMRFVDFSPALPRVLSQRYPKAGTANPRVRVGVVGLDGEANSVVWATLPGEWEYVARVLWHPDGRRLAVETLDRAQQTLRLHLLDRRTGKGPVILTETDPGWVNIHDDLVFLESRPEFLWVSERDGWAHIYRYGLDGTLINRVTRGSWAVRDSGGVFWLRRAIKAVDENLGRVYFSALEKSPLENHLYSVELDGTGMRRLTEARGRHATVFAKDARRFTDVWSNAERPPELALVDANAGERAVLAPAETAPLEGFAMRYPEFVTIPADDGFPMPAYVVKPRDFEEGRSYPLIVYVYGGPSAPQVADRWGRWTLFEQVLTNAGFAVVCFDNRSATAQSKTLENTILHRLGGPGEERDLAAGIRWLQEQSWVDPQRVGLWGWSGGGQMTLRMMTHTRLMKCGIAIAGPSRWQFYDTLWTERFMKLPSDNPEGYAECDLVAAAGDLHGRLLLVHGTYDDNVHFQNTLAFADALIAHGKLFEMMAYPMRKHGIGDRAARTHLLATMLDFWRRNL